MQTLEKRVFKAFRRVNKLMKIEKRTLIILKSEDGRILLQHKDAGHKTLTNHWCFFGGSIEEGETPEQAVRREAKEELQIELDCLKLWKKYEFDDKNEHHIHYYFTAPLKHSIEQLKKQQLEGDDLALFTLEDLKGKILYKPEIKILKEALQKTNG